MTPVAPQRARLRIAIQRKGRIGDPSRELLAACGISWRESRDGLFCYGEGLGIDLLLVRDDDIPGLVAKGVADLGIVGRNELAEQDLARAAAAKPTGFREVRQLGFGPCRLDIAIPDDWEWRGPAQLEGLRIATSYPELTGRWLAEHGVSADIVTLMGSVEIAPRLGQADVICDLVSSGATLRANQLKPVETIFTSEAVLVGSTTPLEDARADLEELLLRRLDGVRRIQNSKLLLGRVDRASLDAVVGLLPDADAPTVVEVVGSADEVAIQALCHGTVSWPKLEELKAAGVRGLMLLPVEGMLV